MPALVDTKKAGTGAATSGTNGNFGAPGSTRIAKSQFTKTRCHARRNHLRVAAHSPQAPVPSVFLSDRSLLMRSARSDEVSMWPITVAEVPGIDRPVAPQLGVAAKKL